MEQDGARGGETGREGARRGEMGRDRVRRGKTGRDALVLGKPGRDGARHVLPAVQNQFPEYKILLAVQTLILSVLDSPPVQQLISLVQDYPASAEMKSPSARFSQQCRTWFSKWTIFPHTSSESHFLSARLSRQYTNWCPQCDTVPAVQILISLVQDPPASLGIDFLSARFWENWFSLCKIVLAMIDIHLLIAKISCQCRNWFSRCTVRSPVQKRCSGSQCKTPPPVQKLILLVRDHSASTEIHSLETRFSRILNLSLKDCPSSAESLFCQSKILPPVHKRNFLEQDYPTSADICFLRAGSSRQ